MPDPHIQALSWSQVRGRNSGPCGGRRPFRCPHESLLVEGQCGQNEAFFLRLNRNGCVFFQQGPVDDFNIALSKSGVFIRYDKLAKRAALQSRRYTTECSVSIRT